MAAPPWGGCALQPQGGATGCGEDSGRNSAEVVASGDRGVGEEMCWLAHGGGGGGGGGAQGMGGGGRGACAASGAGTLGVEGVSPPPSVGGGPKIAE